MMDWTLALLKNRRGGGHSESGVQRDDHLLLSLVLLLATDAIGASIGAFLRSFIKSSTQPLVCPSESMHQTRKDVGENSKTDILRSESCTSDKESSELLQQLPLPSNIIMKYAPHEPTLLDIRGLRNRGQTCYANSVFQALASLPSFCTYLQYLELKGAKSLGHELYETMQYVNGHDIGIRPKRRILGKLLFNSSSSPIVYGDPYKVLDIVARNHSQFRSRSGMFAGTSEQQDVHEFLTALMDVLSVEDH
jgi:ubiquitin C-terminal hydrolase